MMMMMMVVVTMMMMMTMMLKLKIMMICNDDEDEENVDDDRSEINGDSPLCIFGGRISVGPRNCQIPDLTWHTGCLLR